MQLLDDELKQFKRHLSNGETLASSVPRGTRLPISSGKLCRKAEINSNGGTVKAPDELPDTTGGLPEKGMDNETETLEFCLIEIHPSVLSTHSGDDHGEALLLFMNLQRQLPMRGLGLGTHEHKESLQRAVLDSQQLFGMRRTAVPRSRAVCSSDFPQQDSETTPEGSSVALAQVSDEHREQSLGLFHTHGDPLARDPQIFPSFDASVV
ncbi:hypothetical protein DNTS_031452 [Danionella cerebrum]|uniref:Uncharacterized protein n=1 Tax=Danionella cerebrum TaxID=2873325 RepID=A0A553QQS4_9TELE|nr:hypothetical protein DNTS_031452 [Danionella translucida]